MKVFFDHQIYVRQKFGGINRYFDELLKIDGREVSTEKIDPEILSEFHGQKADLVSRGSRFVRNKMGLKKEFGQSQIDLRLKQKFSNTAFDIFHPTYYDPYFLKLTDKPFVLTVFDMIHEIFYEYFASNDKTSHNKRILCNKASAIIAISENTKKDLVEIFKIPPKKIHAVPLASDFNSVIPSKPANSEQLGKFILFTGNRWGYKNFYFPVMALADIIKKDAELQLLCTGHPFSLEELQFFKDIGISEQVKHIFLQNDRELAWAYQNAVIFIFPSLYEGFGFPLLEAFASRCPVISSEGGSLREVGGDGALYFDPKDMSSIRDAAQRAIYDKALRERIIEKGILIFNNFSWDKCRLQTLEIYKSIIN